MGITYRVIRRIEKNTMLKSENMMDKNPQEKQSPKLTTISVRIEDELLKELETVSKIMCISKSDFLRACIVKLCSDNQPVLDHTPRMNEYIEFIKNETAKLPSDMVVVEHGTWKDVKESTIIMMCDELWKKSDLIYDEWIKFMDEYDYEPRPKIKREEGLLSIASIAMITAKKSGIISGIDIIGIINNPTWSESVEFDKIALAYSTKKAIEEKTAKEVFNSYLVKESAEHGEKHRLVIDARGTLRRSGTYLYLPVDTEPVKKK
jgi:metal-responsive CopG/Arc/MetJ family transcriptional regulator